jgi:hypothetical protein
MKSGDVQIKKIVTVAAFTVIGTGAALAQGTPPGSVPWQSGWPAYVASRQVQAMSPRKEAPRPADSSVVARVRRPIPVAGNVTANSGRA